MTSPYALSGGAMSEAQSQAMAAAYQRQADANMKEIANKYKLGQADISARLKIAAQSSRDTRYGIDAERDTAREQIELSRQEMERIGIPRVEIERFVAETTAELARQELALKRDVFLAESGLARDRLNADIREMEEIGIPRVQIERYAAEKAAELGQLEYGLKRDQYVEEARQFGVSFEEARRQYDQTHAEEARQFNVGASGYMTTPGQLTAAQQARLQQLEATDAQLKAQGVGQGIESLAPGQTAELYALRDLASGVSGGQGGGQQATLEREEMDRRYGLDVAKWGAELASTPDTYFQARAFQGVDVPRLLGGAGAPTSGPAGSPVPGVARMGAYLSGQDPWALPSGGPSAGGTPYGGPTAGAPQPAAPGTLGLPGTPEDDRAKQVAKIAALSPPSPYDGLDEQDTNTLKLMSSIYAKGGRSIAGGEYERLAASGRLGYVQSAGKVLGYDPKQLESDYLSYRPSQGDSRLG